MTKFGAYVKELRLKKRITLRDFCRAAGYDPSNWSKIERGLLPPPKSKEIIKSVAEALRLDENSEEHLTLMELAAISYIPRDLLTSENITEKLPVFFRTMRGEKPTREELEKLIQLLQE